MRSRVCQHRDDLPRARIQIADCIGGAVTIPRTIVVGSPAEDNNWFRTVPIYNLVSTKIGSFISEGVFQGKGIHEIMVTLREDFSADLSVRRLWPESFQVISKEHVPVDDEIESGSLPSILECDMNIKRLSNNWGAWRSVVKLQHSHAILDDIRTLVRLKLPNGSEKKVFRDTPLPPSNSSVDNDSHKRKPFQPHFVGLTSKIGLALGFVCGSIFFAFGVVSLFLIWGKIGMHGSAHMNVMFALGLLFSAGFILVGQWILFSVSGLMP